jgi:hypothetical protein
VHTSATSSTPTQSLVVLDAPAIIRPAGRVRHPTASDLGPKGIDEQFGAGLADARRAESSLGVAKARARPAAAMLFADRWPDLPLLLPSRE